MILQSNHYQKSASWLRTHFALYGKAYSEPAFWHRTPQIRRTTCWSGPVVRLAPLPSASSAQGLDTADLATASPLTAHFRLARDFSLRPLPLWSFLEGLASPTGVPIHRISAVPHNQKGTVRINIGISSYISGDGHGRTPDYQNLIFRVGLIDQCSVRDTLMTTSLSLSSSSSSSPR